MLLSLVIVAVEITSFTVACFSLVALLCFFSSIKKKSQQKTNKLWTKKGTKSVCGPPLLIVPGVVLPPPLPYSFSPDTEVGKQGRLSFCKTLKSGVCTICAALLVWDRRKLNQESIVFRDCFSRNNNLVPYVINHLFSSPCPPCSFPSFNPVLSSILYLSPQPPPRLPRPLKCC